MSAPTNHGTVVREIAEYIEPFERIVICELADGWHVVEVYRPLQRTIRYVCETLPAARRWAYARIACDGRDS